MVQTGLCRCLPKSTVQGVCVHLFISGNVLAVLPVFNLASSAHSTSAAWQNRCGDILLVNINRKVLARCCCVVSCGHGRVYASMCAWMCVRV